jgi:hypothetical protein
MSTTNFDPTAFERATDGLLQVISREQAQAVVNYRGDDALRQRIDELAEKRSSGAISEKERAEYGGYVRGNKFIATLQAKARRILSAP